MQNNKQILTSLSVLIAVEMMTLTNICPETKYERILFIKYASCVCGLINLYLSYEDNEKVRYGKCLILQQIELQKEILRSFYNGKSN